LLHLLQIQYKMTTIGNRRPLDLSMSDGETEDEDKPRQAPKSTDELIAEADELIVKKKARHTKPFTEDVLTHPDGLQRIYEEFPVACKFRGRGSEAKDIKKLMAMYREWAFQLHPALAFSDIISKCESLGSKGKTRYFIQNLRDRERSRYIVSTLSYPPWIDYFILNHFVSLIDGSAGCSERTARSTATCKGTICSCPCFLCAEGSDATTNCRPYQ